MLDYHLHLWPHGEASADATVDELARYCEVAATRGVHEIAVTEHLFRFRQATDALGPVGEDEPDPALRAGMVAYWDDHARADLDAYVTTVQAAKAAGLPIVLGLEVDFHRGRMHEVAELLAGYPFDVLLGSVHWLGAWLFDYLEDPSSMAEWGRRGVDAVWDAYTAALEELAASATCDVLAHPDLCKVRGDRPAAPAEFYERMVEAAAGAGMAAEVSAAGWRKPVGEPYPAPDLLGRFKAAGVPVTTASDGHGLAQVAERVVDLTAVLAAAGYDEVQSFRARVGHPVALVP